MDWNREQAYIVTVSDDGISCRRPTGLVESVRWDDLRTVLIETTDRNSPTLELCPSPARHQRRCRAPARAVSPLNAASPSLRVDVQVLAGVSDAVLERAQADADTFGL